MSGKRNNGKSKGKVEATVVLEPHGHPQPKLASTSDRRTCAAAKRKRECVTRLAPVGSTLAGTPWDPFNSPHCNGNDSEKDQGSGDTGSSEPITEHYPPSIGFLKSRVKSTRFFYTHSHSRPISVNDSNAETEDSPSKRAKPDGGNTHTAEAKQQLLRAEMEAMKALGLPASFKQGTAEQCDDPYFVVASDIPINDIAL